MRLQDIVAGAVLNCPPGTTCLAAVSGGADSVAMLCALADVREKAFELRCIHVEHGIRPEVESRGDAEFVKSLCKELNVPCKVVHVKPGRIAAVAKERGIGVEAAARLFRRRAWFHEAKRLNARILVAHTADDALETTLMRILRGAGPSGLAAMPASRGRILRPLISLRRSDVIDYLKEKKIPWREDKTNADIQFLRNRVRLRLIPLLNESFPQWRAALESFAETQSLAADFIQSEAGTRVLWQALGASRDPALYTDAGVFFAQPALIREEALFQGIDRLLSLARVSIPSRTVKRKNIRRFCEGAITAADLGPVRIKKDSQKIILSPAPSPHEYGFSLLINKPGLYTLKGAGLEVCEAKGKEGEGVFFAFLPLALRPGLKEDAVKCFRKPSGEFIAAIDTLGTAACITRDKLLWRRDNQVVSEKSGLCTVKIFKAGVEETDV
jgi:tRNA(Ile)-lysidine synthase